MTTVNLIFDLEILKNAEITNIGMSQFVFKIFIHRLNY